METFTLRLLLPPLVIALATLAQHRLGDRLGGLVVGLPLTSGTFLGIVLLTHGPQTVAVSASGMLTGQVGVIVTALLYARLTERVGVVPSLVGATLAWAATVWLVRGVDGTLLTALLYVAVAALCLRAWPAAPSSRSSTPASPMRPGATVARVLVGSGVVIGLTAGVRLLGADLAGALSAAPLIAIVLTPATHRDRGGAAARALLRGVAGGSVGAAVFAVVLVVAVGGAGALAFGCAGLACCGAAALVGHLSRPADTVVG